jgi:cellulose synthase/poly-beta-1,6-N-acetylglucosamine synthase-like glycosyltransferase
MNEKVTIIIPAYKDWKRLRLCLDALEQQTYPRENFEIIVVNNDPGESIPAGFRFSENLIIIDEVKPGSYAARNSALKIAKGDIIGFTDSDCIPDKNWIKNAVLFLNENKSFSRVAGPVQIILKSKRPTIIEKYNQLFAFPQIWLINNGGGSVTANLFVYKSVFNEIGGFDESLMSMGDKHWGMKAEAAGFKIAYVENVSVLHPPRNLSELIKKEKRHGGAVKIRTESNIKILKTFFSELLPKPSNYRFIFSKRKDLRIIDRFAIPILRHFLLVVRAYEAIKVQKGKKPVRT